MHKDKGTMDNDQKKAELGGNFLLCEYATVGK